MGTRFARSSHSLDDQSQRFLDDWLDEHRARMGSLDDIDGLALKLLTDAYECGAPMGALLSALGGDPFSFLHAEARRAHRPLTSRFQHLVQRLTASIPAFGRSHTG
jgi:hypothetical protein